MIFTFEVDVLLRGRRIDSYLPRLPIIFSGFWKMTEIQFSPEFVSGK